MDAKARASLAVGGVVVICCLLIAIVVTIFGITSEVGATVASRAASADPCPSVEARAPPLVDGVVVRRQSITAVTDSVRPTEVSISVASVNTAAGYRSVVEAIIPLVFDAEVIRGYPAAVAVVDSDILLGVGVVCAGASPAAVTRSTAKAGASLAGGGVVVIRDPPIAADVLSSTRQGVDMDEGEKIAVLGMVDVMGASEKSAPVAKGEAEDKKKRMERPREREGQVAQGYPTTHLLLTSRLTNHFAQGRIRWTLGGCGTWGSW